MTTFTPGEEARAIVRDGMADVLHWLRECDCYAVGSHRLCRWRHEQLTRSFARVEEEMRKAQEAFEHTARGVERYIGATRPHELPLHRTWATWPPETCGTCDGGGCWDCTDPTGG